MIKVIKSNNNINGIILPNFSVEQALNKALSLKPDYAEAYNNMGNVRIEQNNLDKAIELFKKSI